MSKLMTFQTTMDLCGPSREFMRTFKPTRKPQAMGLHLFKAWDEPEFRETDVGALGECLYDVLRDLGDDRSWSVMCEFILFYDNAEIPIVAEVRHSASGYDCNGQTEVTIQKRRFTAAEKRRRDNLVNVPGSEKLVEVNKAYNP